MPDTRLAAPAARLCRLSLDGKSLTRLSPELEADRAQAVTDLLAENRFAPRTGREEVQGPYSLHLSIRRRAAGLRHPRPPTTSQSHASPWRLARSAG